MSSNRFRSN